MLRIIYCLMFVAIGCSQKESFTEQETATLKSIAAAVGNSEQQDEILRNANIKTAQSQIASFGNMVNDYLLMVGELPNSLDNLHQQPKDMLNPKAWTQISARPIPVDPWGNPYNYSKKDQTFKISSNGPDQKPNTADDISNED